MRFCGLAAAFGRDACELMEMRAMMVAVIDIDNATQGMSGGRDAVSVGLDE